MKALLALVPLLSGCVMGIPPPDGYEPKKVKRCEIPVIERGAVKWCMTREEWREMSRRAER